MHWNFWMISIEFILQGNICFTPKGDLKILPQGATALVFAFEIHTDVGYHCIGAKKITV
jgi:(p)ppGpp synthase/HD superfamily hydrolase